MAVKGNIPDHSEETRSCILQSHRSYNTITSTTTPLSIPEASKLTVADIRWMLVGLWSGVFLGALDGTIVATLLTSVGSYFNKSHQASYIGTSYLLAVCCFTPLYGRLSDIIGRRGAMLLALSLFGSGTIICGLAPSMETLIAARALAGMGGGGLMTVSSVAVTDLIPLQKRGLYQGMANILYGLGAALGGPLGGWVNDTFGWRATFLFQAPIIAFSFTLVTLKVKIPLPNDVKNTSVMHRLNRIDLLGCLTLVGAIGCLLLAVSLKATEELPWSHPAVWGSGLAAVICASLFILVENFWAHYPVLPLRLITRRTPLAISLSNFFGSASTFSMLYNVPLYLSTVRSESSAYTGLHLLPHSIVIPIGSLLAGWMMKKTGKLYHMTLLSAAMMTFASIMVVFWGRNSSAFHFYVDIVPQGFGMASLITTTLIAMITSVSKDDMAVATGVTYLFRTTGQALGVSLSGSVLQAVLVRTLRVRVQGPDSTKLIDEIRHSATIIPTLDPPTREAAIDSYADALHVVFICQVAVNFICLLSCVPIQEHSSVETRNDQEERPRNQGSRDSARTEA